VVITSLRFICKRRIVGVHPNMSGSGGANKMARRCIRLDSVLALPQMLADGGERGGTYMVILFEMT
jgi:hypothetical protein